MPTLHDLGYMTALAAASPYWLARRGTRTKVLNALRERDGRVSPFVGDGPRVLVHGVSLGEVNAARPIVTGLREAGVAVVVAATTRTGHARARDLYGDAAVRYPVDTSAAVGRFLDAVRPSVAVSMELEVWPNFTLLCGRRGVPLVVANGRITRRSFAGYRRLGPVVRPSFRRLARVLAQEAEYAERFVALGTPADRVEVVGSTKFDAAPREVDRDDALAAAVGMSPGETVIVAGSTGPGEEAIVLDAVRGGRGVHLRASEVGQPANAGSSPTATPEIRLVIVPRHPERFDEVADLIARDHALVRRSGKPGRDGPNPVILGDTVGELRAFYSLADLAVVGRTLVDLGERQHGSDMIEPCAMGRPTVVGPFTGNFAGPMRQLLDAGGIVQIDSADDLAGVLRGWLDDPAAAAALGGRAAAACEAGRGATGTTIDRILRLIPEAAG